MLLVASVRDLLKLLAIDALPLENMDVSSAYAAHRSIDNDNFSNGCTTVHFSHEITASDLHSNSSLEMSYRCQWARVWKKSTRSYLQIKNDSPLDDKRRKTPAADATIASNEMRMKGRSRRRKREKTGELCAHARLRNSD